MKKLVSLFLCLILLMGIMPLAAPARAAEIVDSGTCGANGDNLTWTLDSNGVLTISGTGPMKAYDSGGAPWYSFFDSRVKQAVISRGVTSIGSYAFHRCTGLTSVSIPNSVTSIGDYTFCGCTGLTSISIPDSVTSIGGHAFYGCTGLTSVSIPNSVTSIGGSAFFGCTGLTSVSIPNSVTSIGYGAFSCCTGLTSVSIPDSVTSIDGYAFENCTSLTNISIPNSVTSIGGGAFSNCTGLTSVSIPDGVTSIGYRTFYNCTGLTSIVIPDSVTYIGGSAFSGCTGLTSIVLPNRLWWIDDSAFQNCSKLKSVVIPASVTSLGGHAFDGCGSLTEAAILGNVSTIGEYCFLNCSALKSVTLPASVSTIETGAFRYCTSLTDVYFAGSEEEWNQITIRSYNDPLNSAMIHFGETPIFITSIASNKTTSKTGKKITWTATAAGGTGTLQYYFILYKDGTKIATRDYSTTKTFSYTPAEPGTYKVKVYVKDAAGTKVNKTSSGVTVTLGPPVITTQPANQSVAAGATATFTVAVVGTGLTYQWQYSNDGTTWTNCKSTGYNTATFSFKATASLNGRQYRCKVSNTAGSVYSNPAQLTVSGVKPTILTQPASQSVTAGTTVTFKVVATGATGYQWQYSDNGSTWTNCKSTGYNTATFSFKATASLNGRQYRCVVSNAAGSVYSNAATLTVTSASTKPTITTQPGNATVDLGKSTTFKVTATGATSYQWEYSKNNGKSWTTWSGKTSASLKVTASATNNGCLYRCVVTNSVGSVTSNAAQLTVSGVKPTILTQPASKSVTAGTTVSLKVVAAGTGLTYQWQYSTNGTTWTNCKSTGYNTATFSFKATATLNGRQYRCVVSNASGDTNSENAKLTVS